MGIFYLLRDFKALLGLIFEGFVAAGISVRTIFQERFRQRSTLA
jgi:hypothetical protein